MRDDMNTSHSQPGSEAGPEFTQAERAEGIWTMTDSEFKRELAAAWDAGRDAAVHALMHDKPEPKNAYRSDRG